MLHKMSDTIYIRATQPSARGHFLPAKAFLNARLDFCVSKPIKNQNFFFFIQNGVFFSNNKVLLSPKISFWPLYLLV
jgi:hypothetical protein